MPPGQAPKAKKRSKFETAAEMAPIAAAVPFALGPAALTAGHADSMIDPTTGAKATPGVTPEGIKIGDTFIPWFGSMSEEGGTSGQGFDTLDPEQQSQLLTNAGFDEQLGSKIIDAVNNYTVDTPMGEYFAAKIRPLIEQGSGQQNLQAVTSDPAESTAEQAKNPFPPISPMAMQMFYQQTVAPYLQLAGMMQQGAIGQYKSSMDKAMSLPGMKENQAAQAMAAEVPMQVFGAEMLNDSLMAATAAAPAADMFQKNLNVAWQQGLSNLNAYLSALGGYSQAQTGGMDFASLLAGGGSPTASGTSPAQAGNTGSIMQNAMANANNIVYPTVPAAQTP